MDGKNRIHRKKIISPKVVKILATAVAVILQAAIIIVPYVFFRDYIARINWVFEIISVLVVLYLVKSDMSPVYKIPWIVIIMLFPVFGGVLYIVYGRRHFGKKESVRVNKALVEYHEAIASRPNEHDSLAEENPDIAVQAEYLYRMADAPAYKNTTAQFFPLGDDMLPVMLEELEKAEKFIFMEYFIVEEGEMLNSIIDVLERKVKEGVDVRFMYDSIGSLFKAPGDYVRSLRKKGIKCFEFNSFRTIYDSRCNNRDHRKICVIDGKVGFTGGVNFADEYINRKVIYGHWKDTAIMLKGDAVWAFTTMFLTMWDVSVNNFEDCKKYYPDDNYSYDDGYFVPYTDYPNDDESVGKNVYLNMINRANRYVYIMTPYLILDNVMVTALSNAAKNGVDVRIITPGIPDKKIAFMLTQSYYEILIKAGVKIYEYTPGFVHAKIFVSDDEVGVVGTINLDYRSLTHHYENAVWIYKSKVIEHIKNDYDETLSKCHNVTYKESRKKSFIKRLMLPILRLFSPMF